MYCSLKFILIVFFGYCRHSSSYVLDHNRHASSKVHSIILYCIAGGILVAVLVLTGIVISLYVKVVPALKALKVPLCLALKNNPAMAIQDKVAAATPVITGPCPNLRYCDKCNFCDKLDPLPPCFCDVYEGL